ncbi:MAG: hypothetical protein K8S97_16370 [Anaerolineae bacterium]|nr:hypothetical protein [Anaerolineae bacterium]
MEQMTLKLWGWLGAGLGTLLITGAIVWAGKYLTLQARGLWQALRGHQAALIAAVDEPQDAVNVQLAQLSGVPAAVWAAFLPAFLSAVADGLASAADMPREAAPPGAGNE